MAGLNVAFQRLDRLYEEFREEFLGLFDGLMKKGNFILGQEVREFEREFAAYCGTTNCVGLASGLDALTLSLNALNLKQGDEVIVPANTYIATWIAVSRSGLKPVPVEPEEEGFQMDSNKIREHITDRTKVIMPVHLYYQMPDMDAINELARDYSLRVVADSAQAHGATYKGRKAGSTAEIEAFSFFPTKNLGAFGDGGAVVTGDNEVAERLRMLRNYGTREKYISEIIGYNSRLDEVQAAFLRFKLKALNQWNAKRRSIAKKYLNELDVETLQLPKVKDYANPNWHIFPIMCDFRDELSRGLERNGVQSIVHYPVPPYSQGAYSSLGLSERQFPISTRIARNILSIPMHPYMTEEETDYVIEMVNDLSREHRKLS